MVNKSYTSNADGSTVRIVKAVNESIVELDNGSRISLSRLNDPSYWTENIDPENFFQRDANHYSEFINKIKSIPDSHIRESNEMGVQTKEVGVFEKAPTNYANNAFTPASEEVPVYHQDPEAEKQELLRKYTNATNINTQQINNQAQKMRQYLDEDEINIQLPPQIGEAIDETVQTIVVDRNENPVVQTVQNTQVQTIQNQPMASENSMFKNIKRNTDFKVKLELDNKIPRVDFISMWEDSYEVSIIDYLANEFVQKLLSDPSSLKEKIVEQLNEAVYGKKKEEPKKEVAKPAKKEAVKKAVVKKVAAKKQVKAKVDAKKPNLTE